MRVASSLLLAVTAPRTDSLQYLQENSAGPSFGSLCTEESSAASASFEKRKLVNGKDDAAEDSEKLKKSPQNSRGTCEKDVQPGMHALTDKNA